MGRVLIVAVVVDAVVVVLEEFLVDGSSRGPVSFQGAEEVMHAKGVPTRSGLSTLGCGSRGTHGVEEVVHQH